MTLASVLKYEELVALQCSHIAVVLFFFTFTLSCSLVMSMNSELLDSTECDTLVILTLYQESMW